MSGVGERTGRELETSGSRPVAGIIDGHRVKGRRVVTTGTSALPVLVRARMAGRAALAGGACALTLVLTGVALALAVRNEVGVARLFTGFTGALVLAAVSQATVGTLIAVRRPANRIGWLLCTGAVLAAFTAAVGQYARLGLVTAPGSVPGAVVAAC